MFEACPARLRAVVSGCARDATPAPVAAMRILMAAASEAEVWELLQWVESCGDEGPHACALARLRAAARIIRERPEARQMTMAVLAEAEHERPGTTTEADLAHWSAVFDRAVRVSPEGSVALYSLGDPDLLEAATAEVAARLRLWGLVGRDRAMLDLGCGIGRFAAALAPEMGRIVGADISEGMLREARRRCAGLEHVGFALIAGGDLSVFPDESFDLVLAADVFPYLFASSPGAAEAQIAEAARVLKRGRDLLVLNFSYRDDVEADLRDLRSIADRRGLILHRSEPGHFELWDAHIFHLAKTI